MIVFLFLIVFLLQFLLVSLQQFLLHSFSSTFNFQNSDINDLIVARLNKLLLKYIAANPSAVGSKLVTIQELIEYRVRCIVCKMELKANGQVKKEHYTPNWNVQIFERHFDNRHLKKVVTASKKNK